MKFIGVCTNEKNLVSLIFGRFTEIFFLEKAHALTAPTSGFVFGRCKIQSTTVTESKRRTVTEGNVELQHFCLDPILEPFRSFKLKFCIRITRQNGCKEKEGGE